jgi:hypothetical protein
MQFARAYVPFVRQIMDWHRFRQHGYGVSNNPFLSIDIVTTHTIDKAQLQRAIWQLLNRNAVLRTQFVVGQSAMLHQVTLDTDSPLFHLRRYTGKPSDVFAAIAQENVSQSIDDAVLFKVCLVESGLKTHIRLYAHQLIADQRSMTLLRSELVTLYRNPINIAEKASSQQYAAYKNHRLYDQYTADLTFIHSLLAPVDRTIFTTDQASKTETLTGTLQHLCGSHYYHFSSKEANSYRSALPIANAEALMTNLRQHHSRLLGLLLVAYARVCRIVGIDKRLIGVLYNDGYSPQVNQTVGHYIGESFIDIDRLLDNSDELAALEPLQHHLIKLYKHAIFNYNLYNINEAVLYKHCIGFVNYTEVGDELPYSVDVPYFEALDSVHFDLDPVFCCYQDAISICWRYSKRAFTDQQIISIDTLFRAELSRLIRMTETSGVRGINTAKGGKVPLVWGIEIGA